MKRAVWLVEACFIIFLSIPLAVLPLQWSLKAGEVLGLLLFLLWRSRRKTAIDNLRRSAVFQERTITQSAENIIRENFKNMGRSFVEVIKIYFGLDRKIIDSVRLEGGENFHKARSKGKGVILITGHCGNWELLAIVTSLELGNLSIVARPIDNPYLNDFVSRVRIKYGSSIIYKKGALRPIIQTLRNNGIVGILIDQAVVRDEGFVIDFLGRGAWTTKMPALIARKTGAAVLPAFIHRTDNGHVITMYPEVELSHSDDREGAVKEDTIMFSRYIEEYIKKYPAEWLWIHRRWKRVKQD